VPLNELGAVAHWNQPFGAEFLFVAGADVRDVRIWDQEQTYTATPVLTNLADHQRDSAGYLEAMWTHHAWTLTASGRLDWFQNYDANLRVWNGTEWVTSPTQPPTSSELIFDPRMGVSRKLGNHWALSASGFRAFRAPTPSELYRSTQVGNKLTLPNSSLLSERATGWETGVASQWHWGTIRVSYFDTEVNRPIVALTLTPNPSPILLMRENLGDHPWAHWAEMEHEVGTALPGMTSRWNAGKDLSWESVRIERVVEVKYNHFDGRRFRHPVQFHRWRFDKRPENCTFEQMEKAPPVELHTVFGAR